MASQRPVLHNAWAANRHFTARCDFCDKKNTVLQTCEALACHIHICQTCLKGDVLVNDKVHNIGSKDVGRFDWRRKPRDDNGGGGGQGSSDASSTVLHTRATAYTDAIASAPPQEKKKKPKIIPEGMQHKFRVDALGEPEPASPTNTIPTMSQLRPNTISPKRFEFSFGASGHGGLPILPAPGPPYSAAPSMHGRRALPKGRSGLGSPSGERPQRTQQACEPQAQQAPEERPKKSTQHKTSPKHVKKTDNKRRKTEEEDLEYMSRQRQELKRQRVNDVAEKKEKVTVPKVRLVVKKGRPMTPEQQQQKQKPPKLDDPVTKTDESKEVLEAANILMAISRGGYATNLSATPKGAQPPAPPKTPKGNENSSFLPVSTMPSHSTFSAASSLIVSNQTPASSAPSGPKAPKSKFNEQLASNQASASATSTTSGPEALPKPKPPTTIQPLQRLTRVIQEVPWNPLHHRLPITQHQWNEIELNAPFGKGFGLLTTRAQALHKTWAHITDMVLHQFGVEEDEELTETEQFRLAWLRMVVCVPDMSAENRLNRTIALAVVGEVEMLLGEALAKWNV